MTSDPARAKAALRQAVANRLFRLPDGEKARQSAAAGERLRGWLAERLPAKTWILGYWPRVDEIDLQPVWRWWRAQGGGLALPRWMGGSALAFHAWPPGADENALVPARGGLKEPPAFWPAFALEQAAAIIVPGVAWDSRGKRLGRGSGCYDALLASIACPTASVAFEEQRVDAVPAEPHDRPISAVFSASGAWESAG